MDRLDNLEKMWLFYKIKQFTKMAFVILLAVALGGAVAYLALYKTGAMQPSGAQPNHSLPQGEITQIKVAPPKLLEQRIHTSSYPLSLMPDFSFESSISGKEAEKKEANEPANSGTVVSRVGSVSSLEAGYASLPTYDKAIDIAKIYLKQGDNIKAQKWALRANEIDSNDEVSWEIYSTASAKLGQKDQAIKALKAYLNVKPSKKLAKLLDELEGK